jgi:hypothetical protein
MVRIILLIAATLTSLASLEFFIVPYAGICLAWLIVFWYQAKVSKSNSAKAIWFNLGFILLIVGGFETYLYLTNNKLQEFSGIETFRNEKGKQVDLNVRNDILGYAPVANQKFHVTKYQNNDLVYDVVYTIDGNGLRVAPPDQGGNDRECVVFLGDSLTFGHGLNDNQTVPYLTGLKTQGKFRIYNFALGGYGPHQILASLEKGRVQSTVKCQPKYAIYQLIEDHVARAAGLASWDTHGPKYILDKNGQVVYKGHFDAQQVSRQVSEGIESAIPQPIIDAIKKSFIFTAIHYKQRPVNEDDINLMVAIVDKSKKIFEERYPGSEFEVILWNDNETAEQILQKLQAKKIKVYLINDILPEHKQDPSKYQLSKYDKHPNLLANEMIANYVTKHILK